MFMFVPFLLLVRPVRETKQLVGPDWDHSTTVTEQFSFVLCVFLYRSHNDEIQAVAGLELGMTGRISQLYLRLWGSGCDSEKGVAGGGAVAGGVRAPLQTPLPLTDRLGEQDWWSWLAGVHVTRLQHQQARWRPRLARPCTAVVCTSSPLHCTVTGGARVWRRYSCHARCSLSPP